jgi:hypothetical protein
VSLRGAGVRVEYALAGMDVLLRWIRGERAHHRPGGQGPVRLPHFGAAQVIARYSAAIRRDAAAGILEATAITRRSAMQPPSAQPAPQRTALSADETARAEVNFSPYVAQALEARGRFRVSADTPETVELFQKVARRVGGMLRRPVVSYANGREIVITFGQDEPPGLTDRGALSAQG